jgi:hypothetical protein
MPTLALCPMRGTAHGIAHGVKIFILFYSNFSGKCAWLNLCKINVHIMHLQCTLMNIAEIMTGFFQ